MDVLDGHSATRQPRRPLVIAHRGAAGLAPENTLVAFKLAVELAVDGVEMDVQLSADGHPVVIHDRLVNRTTNGRGAVSSLTLSELQNLDAASWFERRRWSTRRSRSARLHPCEPVPTLDAVLSLLAPARLERIYIELKGGPASERLLQTVLWLVNKHRVDRSVTLLSFDHAVVRRAKELAGQMRTAATFPAGRRLVSTRSMIRRAESAEVEEVALHFALATRRTVGAFKDLGFSVSVWTANNKLSMRRLVACGVDSIMTDFPDRLRDVVNSPPKRRRLAHG